MNKHQNHIQDLAEIRSMMERSSKFMSLSGLSGALAGIYALAGVFLAYTMYDFNPTEIISSKSIFEVSGVVVIALLVLVFSVSSAVYLSYRKATSKGENIWNATSRRLLLNVSIPLLAGAGLSLVLFLKGIDGLIPSVTLLFYGVALYSAGIFSYREIKVLGIIQVILGLLAAYFVSYALILWALGFGIAHIIYGTYIHIRHER